MDEVNFEDLNVVDVFELPGITISERLTACFLATAEMSEALENSESMTTKVKKKLSKGMAIVEEQVCPPLFLCLARVRVNGEWCMGE